MDEKVIVESLVAGIGLEPGGTSCRTRNEDMPQYQDGPAVVYTPSSEWPEARRTAEIVESLVASYLTEEEMSLPEKAHQPEGTKEGVLGQADEVHEEMVEWLEGVAEKLGLRWCFQVGNEVPEMARDEEGPILVTTPTKDEERAEEKVDTDYDGDWSRLLDVVRATIAVDREDEIEGVLEVLRASGMELARKPKDKVEDVGGDGFRALHFNVVLPSGHVGELQVMVKPVLVARIEMHDCYEALRELEGLRGGRENLEGEELAVVEAIEGLMSERYEEEWAEAGGKVGRTAKRVLKDQYLGTVDSRGAVEVVKVGDVTEAVHRDYFGYFAGDRFRYDDGWMEWTTEPEEESMFAAREWFESRRMPYHESAKYKKVAGMVGPCCLDLQEAMDKWEEVVGRVAVRTKYKKVEHTTPGSKNHYKVTYNDGQEKWVDSIPGRGEGSRRDKRLMRHKMNSPAVQTSLKSLNTALKKFEDGADKKVLENVVEKNEVSLDKALAKRVNRLFMKTVKKKEGEGIEDKTKEGLDVVKEHVNRHRKDASRFEGIVGRVEWSLGRR